MGWQAPRYIYPTTDTPQYGQALISGLKEGAMMGVSLGGKIKEAATKKSLENDLNQITAEADKKLEALKTPEAAPATGTTIPAAAPVAVPVATTPVAAVPVGTAPVTADQTAPAVGAVPATNVTAPQIGGDKALAMAGAAPITPTAPVTDDIQTKRIEINADMHNKMIKAYYKHGKVEEAQVMEAKYLDQTIKLAGVDYKAASKVWNSSFLKDRYGEVDLAPKPKWKVIQGRDGNPNVIYDENSAVKPQIDSPAKFVTMKEGEKGFMVAGDGNGGYTAVEITKGAPKSAPGDGLRKYNKNGKEVTEEFVDGEWREKATSPKDGSSSKDQKTASQKFDDMFIQNYAGAMVDDTGKAPDKNTVLAKNGKLEVKDKLIDGKPVNLQQLHDKMQEYYEGEIERGSKPAEALNKTLSFGHSYGTTKTAAWDATIPTDKAETVTKAVTAAKKAGAKIKQNKETGEIQADYGDKKVILWDGKASVGGEAKATKSAAKAVEKPAAAKTTEKPAEKPATTPAAAAKPAAKVAAAQKPAVSDLEKKTGIGGTDDKQIADATRKKRIEKLTKEIDQKSIDAQVEEVASYQSRRYGVPIDFARKRARSSIEKVIAGKKAELASLQK